MKHHNMFHTCEQVDNYFDRRFNIQARYILVLKNYITNMVLNADDAEEVKALGMEVLSNSDRYKEQVFGRK